MKAYGQSKLACLMFALEITNDFATVRDVAIFDYPGVGLSSGVTPSTVAVRESSVQLPAGRSGSPGERMPLQLGTVILTD